MEITILSKLNNYLAHHHNEIGLIDVKFRIMRDNEWQDVDLGSLTLLEADLVVTALNTFDLDKGNV